MQQCHFLLKGTETLEDIQNCCVPQMCFKRTMICFLMFPEKRGQSTGVRADAKFLQVESPWGLMLHPKSPLAADMLCCLR